MSRGGVGRDIWCDKDDEEVDKGGKDGDESSDEDDLEAMRDRAIESVWCAAACWPPSPRSHKSRRQ